MSLYNFEDLLPLLKVVLIMNYKIILIIFEYKKRTRSRILLNCCSKTVSNFRAVQNTYILVLLLYLLV